ncbi:hypothetical protein QVD17_03704 [Tagetes erecta]|uniref:Uncharacterized protein n=1 Tax=Tagetes erecta TaxID=13708 RepID=A0AAD8LBT1_TARER|nr:hypothetical protein QVD17_03704 [Tagetes erecta]
MKFLFPELGFCFGGTIVTPTETETISSTKRRRVKRTNSVKHWRPELSVIAEDDSHVSHHQNQTAVTSDKKPLIKPKSSGKTRSHTYGANYSWKFSHTMAIPAFSPTPFVF